MLLNSIRCAFWLNAYHTLRSMSMAKFEGRLYLFGGITARISIITASPAMLRNDLTKSCHDILCLQSTTDHLVYWWHLSRPIAAKGLAPNNTFIWHIRSTRSATAWHSSKRFGLCPFRAWGWEREKGVRRLACFVVLFWALRTRRCQGILRLCILHPSFSASHLVLWQ